MSYVYALPDIISMYRDYKKTCFTLQIVPMTLCEFEEHPEYYLMNPCHNFKGVANV